MANESTIAAFDLDKLLDRVDGDMEFLQETLEMLEEDSVRLLADIRSAIDAREASALVQPAHALKGILSNFCSTVAESFAWQIETMGRESRLDGVAEALEQLDRETRRLKDQLRALLETRAG
jgi:HPt (histidine-containing phosphotransfer) domain-containing protein